MVVLEQAANFFNTHSFLLAVLIGLLPLAFAYRIAVQHRFGMNVSGLLMVVGTICDPSTLFYQDEYWNPIRVGGLAYGLEDVICGFSLGAGIWLASVVWLEEWIEFAFDWLQFLTRFLAVGAVCGTLFSVFWVYIAESAVICWIAVQCIGILLLLFIQPNAWRVIIRTGLLYPPYYFCVLFLTRAFVPDFFETWNGELIWGPRLFGLPVEEYAWLISFSTFWAGMISFLMGIRRSKPAIRRQTRSSLPSSNTAGYEQC